MKILSPDIFRVIKSRSMGWAGHVARMEERRNVYMIFVVGRTRKKRPFGKPKRRREINIKIGVQEIRLRGVD